MGKLRTLLLILTVAALGNFFPTHSAAQETISFTERFAKLQGLRAEQDSLGKKWTENKEKLDQLNVQYDTLDGQMKEGLGRLGKLRAEAETVVKEYERKIPEFDRREAVITAKEQELGQEYNAYSSQCNVTVPEEEYPSLLANCQARYARYSSAWDKNSQDFNQLSREAQTLEDKMDTATKAHDNLLVELQKKEAQQQELVRQGMALEATSAEIVEAGLRLDALIKELEGKACDPAKFSTAEAFEECMRAIFDGGSGTIEGTIGSPIDMSPTGENETSPFDMDPNVVKPDWGEEEDDDG